MAYTITVSPDGAFIVITVTGSLTAELAASFSPEANALSRSLGIRNVLMDVTAAVNSDETYQSYDFAYRSLPRLSDPQAPLRVVAVVRPEDRSHDFVVLAMRNAGFNMEIFRDRAAAEIRLREPQTPPSESQPGETPPFYSFGEDD
ncbi:MAG: hypothetical protein IPP07_00425 [Holophagales bacterium]|jgi:hypothetical protein|nr:hypothetical protein [Holophagales bacterium]